VETKKTSENWDDFFIGLSRQELAGIVLPPQVTLCCGATSMAARLAGGLAAGSKPLMSGEPEVLEFGDGQAAVIFPLKDGAGITRFVSLLGEGDFGTEPLVIKSGIALRLPVSDRQALRQALGIEQILTIGASSQAGQETFVWW
jgi:hypothetical protein